MSLARRLGVVASGGVLLALLAPRAARADGWYVKWTCAGECAGYGNGSRGADGPHATEEECRTMAVDLRAPDDSLLRSWCELVGDGGGPGGDGGAAGDGGGAPGGGGASGGGPGGDGGAAGDGGGAPGGGGAAPKPRIASVDVGALVGPGWSARGEAGTFAGPVTLGAELDLHIGLRVSLIGKPRSE